MHNIYLLDIYEVYYPYWNYLANERIAKFLQQNSCSCRHVVELGVTPYQADGVK